MIEEMEKTAKDMLPVILVRATEIRRTLPLPDPWPPVDYFPGREEGMSLAVPMDDGEETFKVYLARAIEQVAQRVARIQIDHGFSELTVMCVRWDNEFCKTCGYKYVVLWFPKGGSRDPFDDSGAADWWKD